MTLESIKSKLKNAYKSFTIWFNTVGAGLLAVLLVEPSFIEYINHHGLSIVLVIGNLLLRFKTESSLGDK